MNGRIYDPLLGRFLSADLIVQNPTSLQCFNRYSYVMNNPLSLTDPSGFSAETEEQRKARLAAEANARGQIISERGILGYIVAGESAQSMISNAGNSAVSQMASSDTAPLVVFRPPNRLGISIDLERNDGAADLQGETALLEDRIDPIENTDEGGGIPSIVANDSDDPRGAVRLPDVLVKAPWAGPTVQEPIDGVNYAAEVAEFNVGLLTGTRAQELARQAAQGGERPSFRGVNRQQLQAIAHKGTMNADKLAQLGKISTRVGLVASALFAVNEVGSTRGSDRGWVKFGVAGASTAIGLTCPPAGIALATVEMCGGFNWLYDLCDNSPAW